MKSSVSILLALLLSQPSFARYFLATWWSRRRAVGGAVRCQPGAACNRACERATSPSDWSADFEQSLHRMSNYRSQHRLTFPATGTRPASVLDPSITATRPTRVLRPIRTRTQHGYSTQHGVRWAEFTRHRSVQDKTEQFSWTFGGSSSGNTSFNGHPTFAQGNAAATIS